MSRPGGPGGREERRRELVWSALFLLASVVGGLAAADIAHVSAYIALIVSVLITAVLTLLMHYGLLNLSRNDNADHTGQHAGGHGTHVLGVRPNPFPPDTDPDRQPLPSGQPDQAAVRLMQQSAPDTPSWWNPKQTAPATAVPPATAAAEVPVAPKLSSYMDSALIAQCPNCGSFRIDADQVAPQWRFRCRECQQIWTWLPGHPWPPIQVRPYLRKGQQQPPPQRGPGR